MNRRPRKLDSFRIRILRSNDSLFLGVLRGFAEHYGWSVCWTRIIGAVVLLVIPGFFPGEHHGGLFAAGFFYLLLALLMDPPLKEGETAPLRFDADDSDASGSWWIRRRREARSMWHDWNRRSDGREFFGGISGDRSAARSSSPSSGGATPPPLPLAPGGPLLLPALTRQLDSLNRRIARMESIVTRREYDWSRRLED